jgi:hypothetical protein
MNNLQWTVLVGLVLLFVGNVSFGQIHYSSKEKLYLLEDSLELNIIQPEGRNIVQYKKKTAHHYINWSGDRSYPDTILLDQFLVDFKFEMVGTPISKKDLNFSTQIIDSTESFLLPCGNADYPSWKQQYNYQFKINYQNETLYAGKGYTSGFGTTFSKQIAGIKWEYNKYARVWKSKNSSTYYLYVSDGFHIIESKVK